MAHLPENTNHLEQVLALVDRHPEPVALTPNTRGGLIVVSCHYSDFIGPGSRLIWPKHFHCKAIYPVGRVQFCTLLSQASRQASLRNRITGVSVLVRILQDFDDIHRACLLVNFLCHRLGLNVVKQADLSRLGNLVRVLPFHMLEGLRLYEQTLHQLGQAQRLGNLHHLNWKRQLLPLPELLLDSADLHDFGSEYHLTQPNPQTQAVSVGVSLGR
jgi:hypothetical protein